MRIINEASLANPNQRPVYLESVARLKKAPAKLKILRRQSALRPLCLNSPLEMAEI
jgi:hypothetical protein